MKKRSGLLSATCRETRDRGESIRGRCGQEGVVGIAVDEEENNKVAQQRQQPEKMKGNWRLDVFGDARGRGGGLWQLAAEFGRWWWRGTGTRALFWHCWWQTEGERKERRRKVCMRERERKGFDDGLCSLSFLFFFFLFFVSE